MRKREFCAYMQDRNPDLRLPVSMLSAWMELLSDSIAAALLSGHKVRFQGLGVFYLKKLKPRDGYDLNTGEQWHSDGAYKIGFRPSMALRKKLGEIVAPEQIEQDGD